MKEMKKEQRKEGGVYVIYLDYGNNTANQMQTYFSVLSMVAWSVVPLRIGVVTDHAEVYRRLSDYVEVVEVNDVLLQEWRGSMGYSFRIKMKAIQHAVEMAMKKGEAVSAFVFVDSDTFAFRELDALYEEVTDGSACMHKNEGMPYLTRGASRRLWQVVKGKRYADILMEEGMEMWNSGVMGVPASKAKEVCELALRLCDEMLADGVRSFNVEQFCFSVALQQVCGRIQAAEPYICHYWGNKEGWCQRIEEFFMRSYMEGRSVEQDIQHVREMDFTATPYYVRTPIWRKRFMRWADVAAPLKRQLYLKK